MEIEITRREVLAGGVTSAGFASLLLPVTASAQVDTEFVSDIADGTVRRDSAQINILGDSYLELDWVNFNSVPTLDISLDVRATGSGDDWDPVNGENPFRSYHGDLNDGANDPLLHAQYDGIGSDELDDGERTEATGTELRFYDLFSHEDAFDSSAANGGEFDIAANHDGFDGTDFVDNSSSGAERTVELVYRLRVVSDDTQGFEDPKNDQMKNLQEVVVTYDEAGILRGMVYNTSSPTDGATVYAVPESTSTGGTILTRTSGHTGTTGEFEFMDIDTSTRYYIMVEYEDANGNTLTAFSKPFIQP